MKGQSTLLILAGLVIVMIVFVIGIYPAMKIAADSSTSLDPFSTYVMYLVAPGIFIAILAGLLFTAFSKRGNIPS